MGQPGFFDAERRLSALSKKGDPLEAISALVPWESFRADIEEVALTPEAEKKSRAGRKPLDALVLVRMLVLQALYNLSDEQIEYQVRDRLSFTRFLGLEFEDDRGRNARTSTASLHSSAVPLRGGTARTSPRASGPERAHLAEVTAFGTDMTADD